MEKSLRIAGLPEQALLSATLGFFAGFASVALFGPTALRLRAAMELTPQESALLVAVPALSGALLRIPFGVWADARGARRPFLTLLGLALVGMLGLSALFLSRPISAMDKGLYPLFLFLGLLAGAGIATFSVGISQVSYWFSKSKQGRALAFYAGVGNLAPGLFTLFLPLALNALGLAGAYLAWTLLLALGFALYALLGRDAWYFQLRAQGLPEAEARRRAEAMGQELFPSPNPWQGFRLAASDWRAWALVGIYFTTFGGFVALTAWLPTYWQGLHGLGVVWAGVLTAAYSLLTSGIRVLGGALSDALEQGGENTGILAFLVLLSGTILLTLSDRFEVAVPGLFFMAPGMGTANAAVFRLVPQVVPQAVGGASGLVGGLGALGGFVIPPLMGFAVGRHGMAGYPLGFVTFLFLEVFALTLLWVLKYLPRPALDPGHGPGARG